MPALETGIWLFTLAGVAVALAFGAASWSALITWWSAIYLVAVLGLLILLVRSDRKRRDLASWTLIAAMGAAAFVGAHDLLHWFAWIDFEASTLSQLQVPVLLVALGARIVRQHFDAIGEVERSRAELESRVAEKTRAIEANHARLREIERAEALAAERQRIMTDMHDGVGASLVGLLGVVQFGSTAGGEIERRLAETLQELRLTIDALEPVNGDLGAVLGSVRHRMRPAIESSGVAFEWRVGELPRLGYLTPKVIQQIQRIVLEALTNALRHAHARKVSVGTAIDASASALEIQIEDDGVGFDLGSSDKGRGVESMTRRAASIGGRLEVRTHGRGTLVVVRLPLEEAAVPAIAEPRAMRAEQALPVAAPAVVEDRSR